MQTPREQTNAFLLRTQEWGLNITDESKEGATSNGKRLLLI
jgi:hypothetical protein